MKTNRTYLLRVMALTGVLLIPFMQIRSFAPQGVDPGYIRKARTIYPEKLGLEQPAGLAFLPDAGVFVVMEAAKGNQTRLFVMTPHKELVSVASADVGIIDPSNIVFDGRSNRLLAFETVSNDVLDLASATVGPSQVLLRVKTRFPAKRLGLQRARGMTMDPVTGDLFILDGSAMRIVRIKRDQNGDFDFATAIDKGKASSFSMARQGLVEPRGLAYNPVNGHLYFLSPSEQKICELTATGLLVATLDIAPFKLADPQGMVFAPSGDPTDDPSNTNLYIADTGNQGTTQKSGQIVELALTAPVAPDATVPTVQASLVRRTDTWNYIPPSPDPAGVTYLPDSGTLLISDSEVDEMSNLFTGVNLYEVTLSGSLIRTLTTISFSDEPTGVSIDPVSRKLYFSDDNQYRIYTLDPGPDTLYNTPDDRVTSFKTNAFGSYDPEDVAFDSVRGHVLIIDGEGAEVYDVSPGPNGVFDGVTAPGDDAVTHFDTAGLGITDPEGIVFSPDDGHLYLLGHTTHKIAETTIDGTLIRYIDISSANIVMAAGMAYAPASSGAPGEKNFYIVDRGVDNNENSSENDGELYELTLNNPAPTTSSLSPTTANAGGGRVHAHGQRHRLRRQFGSPLE